MTKSGWRLLWCLNFLIVLGLVSAEGAHASDYFKGKSIDMYAGRPPGGGVDSGMRMVARFFGDNLPGKPKIIARNLPGAGGVKLGNFLNTAKPDGLSLGVPGRTAFILSPILNARGAKYKLEKMTWIGSANSSNFMLWISTRTKIRNWEDLKKAEQVVIGGSSGRNSDTVVPGIFKKFEGINFKIVRGYSGVPEELLAMQRGEIDGFVTARESFPQDPDKTGIAVPVLQFFPLQPGLPTMLEVAKHPTSKKLIKLLSLPLRVGLALVGPPGIPDHIATPLRQAYLKTVTSDGYKKLANARGQTLGKPNIGDDLGKFLEANVKDITPEVVKEYMSFSTGKKKKK